MSKHTRGRAETRRDLRVIAAIADRAHAYAQRYNVGSNLDRSDWVMYISVCHHEACALRLDDLLQADEGNFAHDVLGIAANLNHASHLLDGHFVPRFAERATA